MAREPRTPPAPPRPARSVPAGPRPRAAAAQPAPRGSVRRPPRPSRGPAGAPRQSPGIRRLPPSLTALRSASPPRPARRQIATVPTKVRGGSGMASGAPVGLPALGRPRPPPPPFGTAITSPRGAAAQPRGGGENSGHSCSIRPRRIKTKREEIPNRSPAGSVNPRPGRGFPPAPLVRVAGAAVFKTLDSHPLPRVASNPLGLGPGRAHFSKLPGGAFQTSCGA